MLDTIFDDLVNLWCHICIYFSEVNILLLTLIVSFHFLYQYKEENYLSFRNLIYSFAKPTYLYRYLRYSILAVLIFSFYRHFNHSFILKNYSGYTFSDQIYKNIFLNFPQYVILLVIIYYIIYRLFRFRITRYISNESERRYRNAKYTCLRFMTFCSISFMIQLIALYISTVVIKLIDNLLIQNHYFPIDVVNDLSLNLSYQRGVYISVFGSILVVFILINAIVKGFNKRYSLHDFLMYIFILTVVGFGCYSGFYSIFNFLFNYQIFGTDSEWLKNDKLLGNFSLRFTSLILLWSILKFVYKNVFKEDFANHIIYALLPIDPNKSSVKKLGQLTAYEYNYFDSIYFAQIGFYILNVFSAEYLLSNLNIDFYTSFLFLILPVMVDDFFVIHVYHKRFNFIDNWHKIKLWGFNFLLLISSIGTLIIDKHYLFLILYILASALFSYIGHFRYKN